jgi:hypothetical protein
MVHQESTSHPNGKPRLFTDMARDVERQSQELQRKNQAVEATRLALEGQFRLRIQEIEEEHATNGKVKDTKIAELERLVYEKTAGEVKKGLRSDDAPPKKRGGRSRGGRNCELRSVYNGSY